MFNIVNRHGHTRFQTILLFQPFDLLVRNAIVNNIGQHKSIGCSKILGARSLIDLSRIAKTVDGILDLHQLCMVQLGTFIPTPNQRIDSIMSKTEHVVT